MAITHYSSHTLPNPVDLAELVVMDRDWSFDRLDDGQLIAEATGAWCKYQIWFTWQEEHDALTVGCSLDTKIPTALLPKLYVLMALANEKLWLGHFEFDSEEGTVGFRHTMLLKDGGTNSDQLQALLDVAMQECERLFPAVQSMVWGGKAPAEALELALFETIAEA